MESFHAERLIYGKLAGADREHQVVGQSRHWPIAGGVPKCVGFPGDASFAGACSLDWHPAASGPLLALSWCEPGPRITRRDFFQAHHLVAKPADFALVLPFLPEIVAQLRQIPVFYTVDESLPPFVFDYRAHAPQCAADEAWFRYHWPALSAIFSALLRRRSVFVRNDTGMEENLKIIAGLMLILPPHLRAQLTFSTDEYAHRPYWRRVTFAHNNWADCAVDWQPTSAEVLSDAVLHPFAAACGRRLEAEGLDALLDEAHRPEYCRLSFEEPEGICQS